MIKWKCSMDGKKEKPMCRKRKYISHVKFSGRRYKIYNRGHKLFYETILLLCKQLPSIIESYRPNITTLEIRDVTIIHRLSLVTERFDLVKISWSIQHLMICFMSLIFWPFAGIPQALWQIYTCLRSGICRAIFLVKI